MCVKEEKTNEKGQLLFTDESCDRIKCKWCPTFKGSIKACVINQHCKSSKTHIAIRRKFWVKSLVKDYKVCKA